MARMAVAIFVVSAGVAAGAVAQDDPAPDLDFLEYLGSWQESDEEWLLIADELMGSPPVDESESPGLVAEETGEDNDETDQADETDEN
jgi:hypothetical protein